MKSIINLIRSFGRWMKKWGWTIPVQKPERTPPLKIPVTEVEHAYLVVTYHGQHVNMLKKEYPIWKALPRNDKRAMAKRFAVMEKKGQVRFVEINGKLIAIKNRDYEGSKNTN